MKKVFVLVYREMEFRKKLGSITNLTRGRRG